MAKWYGKIGFGDSVEVKPDVWRDQIVEKEYYGNVIRNARRLQTAGQVNDNLTISNQISIIADPYAQNHFYQIRYVIFQGVKWKVTNVEVQWPRLVMDLGDVFTSDGSREAQ